MNNHHACLVRQSKISIPEALALYGELDDKHELQKLSFTSIGIDEVRKIILEANYRPSEGEYRLLVVATESVTFEAQQALLKILEEPPVSAKFLFVLPKSLTLVPTLASRFFDLTANQGEEYLPGVDFPAFLSSDYATRLKEVTDRLAKKDTAWVENMKLGLASYLAHTKVSDLNKLKTLQFILRSLGTRGASNKLLLEELALTLPK